MAHPLSIDLSPELYQSSLYMLRQQSGNLQFCAPPVPGRYRISAVRDRLTVLAVLKPGPRKDLYRLKTRKSVNEDLACLGRISFEVVDVEDEALAALNSIRHEAVEQFDRDHNATSPMSIRKHNSTDSIGRQSFGYIDVGRHSFGSIDEDSASPPSLAFSGSPTSGRGRSHGSFKRTNHVAPLSSNSNSDTDNILMTPTPPTSPKVSPKTSPKMGGEPVLPSGDVPDRTIEDVEDISSDFGRVQLSDSLSEPSSKFERVQLSGDLSEP